MNNKWTWLKEYMQKNNISQGEVADALQWQKTRVSELLGGKRDFPVNKVFPAARFFNLDLEEFTKYNSGFPERSLLPTANSRKSRRRQTWSKSTSSIRPAAKRNRFSRPSANN